MPTPPPAPPWPQVPQVPLPTNLLQPLPRLWEEHALREAGVEVARVGAGRVVAARRWAEGWVQGVVAAVGWLPVVVVARGRGVRVRERWAGRLREWGGARFCVHV